MVRTNPKKAVAEVTTPDFMFAAWVSHVGPQAPVWNKFELDIPEVSQLEATLKPVVRAPAPGLVAQTDSFGVEHITKFVEVVVVRKKWAYIFVETNSETRTLFQEVYIDGDGRYWKTSDRQLRNHNRGNPKTKGYGGACTHRLPRSYKGQLAKYYIAYNDRQLQLEIITLLAGSDLPQLTPPVVDTLPLFLPELVVVGASAEEPLPSINVAVGIDILSLPLRLNRIYNTALESRTSWITSRKRVNNEGAQYLFAEQIRTLYDNMSQEFRDKYDDCIDFDLLDRDLRELRKKAKRLESDVHKSAAQLCKVLDSEAYAHIRRSYRLNLKPPYTEEESPDFAIFHYLYAKSIRNLKASAPGNAYLNKRVKEGLLGTPDALLKSIGGPVENYVEKFIMPSAMTPISHFKTVRWSTKAILTIVAEYIPTYITRTKFSGDFTEVLRKNVPTVDWSKYIVRVQKEIPTLTGDGSGQMYRWVDVELIRPTDELIAKANADAQVYKKDFGAGIAIVKVAFDVINIAIALGTVQAELRRENIKAKALARAVTDLAVHVANISVSLTNLIYREAIKDATKQALKRVSVVTGAYFAVVNVWDLEAASVAHDYDKSAALALAAVGEVMGVAGLICGMPVLSIIGGGVAAAGYIWAVLAQDSAIEHFLKHCHYGKFHYVSDTAAGWTNFDKISSWWWDYNSQLRALLYLSIGMAAKWRGEPWGDRTWYFQQTIEIQVGAYRPGMLLESVWQFEWTDGSGRKRSTEHRLEEDAKKFQSALVARDDMVSYTFDAGNKLYTFFSSAEGEFKYPSSMIPFTRMEVTLYLYVPQADFYCTTTLKIVENGKVPDLSTPLTASSLK